MGFNCFFSKQFDFWYIIEVKNKKILKIKMVALPERLQIHEGLGLTRPPTKGLKEPLSEEDIWKLRMFYGVRRLAEEYLGNLRNDEEGHSIGRRVNKTERIDLKRTLREGPVYGAVVAGEDNNFDKRLVVFGIEKDKRNFGRYAISFAFIQADRAVEPESVQTLVTQLSKLYLNTNEVEYLPLYGPIVYKPFERDDQGRLKFPIQLTVLANNVENSLIGYTRMVGIGLDQIGVRPTPRHIMASVGREEETEWGFLRILSNQGEPCDMEIAGVSSQEFSGLKAVFGTDLSNERMLEVVVPVSPNRSK